jgi:hypothetical protein
MGLPPISTMGLGRTSVSSLNLDPMPPARITTFIIESPEKKFLFKLFAISTNKFLISYA